MKKTNRISMGIPAIIFLLGFFSAPLIGKPVLEDGHVDIGIAYEDDSWDLHIHDETGETEYEPDGAILQVGSVSKTVVPNDPNYSFIGNPGTPIWILPQEFDERMLFLGFGAEELTPGTFVDDVVIEGVEISGPGKMFVFTTDAFGVPSVSFNSADGITADDQISVPEGSHTHMNWVFTKPGIYKLRLRAKANLNDGENTFTQSDVVTYTFRVLNDAEIVFDARFNGQGGGTGGSQDIVEIGGKGFLLKGANGNKVEVVGSASLGDGKYLKNTIADCGLGAFVRFVPSSVTSSWGAIFKKTGGNWNVNGGFDFFVRLNKQITASNQFCPIDLTNGQNGIRLKLSNSAANTLKLEVLTPGTQGGGTSISGKYVLTPSKVQHLAVAFKTDPATGQTTVRLFAKQGNGEISGLGQTVGTGGLIAKGSFNLKESAVTNTGGILNGGSWKLGEHSDSNAPKIESFDSFRIYNLSPTYFPAIGE